MGGGLLTVTVCTPDYLTVTKNGRYYNSMYSPSRDYHPITQKDLLRVTIGAGKNFDWKAQYETELFY